MDKNELEKAKNQALKEAEEAATIAELEAVFRKYLGKKGLVRGWLKGIEFLNSEAKKERGFLVKDLQETLGGKIEERRQVLDDFQLQDSLKSQAENLDYETPKIGHYHPLTQTIRMMNRLFAEMGYSVMDGPEIESDEYNFRRLNVPEDHPAREMQDTIYVEEPNWLLRTQTSSIEARVLAGYKPPFKVVCPGRVYRNEKVNKSNHFVFHHYQGLSVMETVSLKDLFGTLDRLFKELYGKKAIVRYRNKYYPEVEPGVGSDMQCFNCSGRGCSLCKGVGWLEMGGAGIVHPNLLKMAGIDPKKWRGFAFGLGLDRWVMAKYKITDIRALLGGSLAYKPNQGEPDFSLYN